MTQHDCRLVPASPADAPAIAALHGEAFPDDPWSPSAVSQVMSLDGAFGFLARDLDRAVGFVLARGVAGECEVLAIAVTAPWRRRDLGGALLGAVVAHAPLLGAKAIHLEVAEDNRAARALYAAAGFKIVGRRPGYYLRGNGVCVSAILYSREV